MCSRLTIFTTGFRTKTQREQTTESDENGRARLATMFTFDFNHGQQAKTGQQQFVDFIRFQ